MKLLDLICFVVVVLLALTIASIVSTETLTIPVLQKNPLRELEIEKAVLYWSPFVNFIRTLIHITLPVLVGVWVIRYAEYYFCKKPAPFAVRYLQIWFLCMMGVSYFQQLTFLFDVVVYGTIVICALYIIFYQLHRAPLRDGDIW